MSEETEKARFALINDNYKVLKSLAEELDRTEPLLKKLTQKVEDNFLLLKELRFLLTEIKKIDPVPIEEFKKAKDLCIKATLDLHTARNLQNIQQTKIANLKTQVNIAKINYQNATKETQAQIYPFPGRD